jgi:cation transport regulator ChaB
MPYASNSELPVAIKSLPGAAQSIWRGAFTGFTKANPKAKEEAGFKVAWAAVKNKYKKNDSGTWVAKDASPGDDDYDGGEQGEDPCPSCGMDIPVGVKVCPNCAQPIEDSMVTDHITLRDTIVMDGVRKTADGYLTCSPRVARVGVQIYKGKELGRPDLGDVRVYRPPQEVFHKDAIKSMTHRPVTLTHPPETVNAGNWKHYSVGHTGDEVLRDGDAIRVPMVVMDAKAIDAYENHGVKELSVGYSTDLKWKKGVTRDGEPYDAIQTAIRGNHLAMVPAARGGETLNMGDVWGPAAWEASAAARAKGGGSSKLIEGGPDNKNLFPEHEGKPLSWDPGSYHTHSEEKAGFPKMRTVDQAMAEHRPEQLRSLHHELIRSSMGGGLFKHNAEKQLGVVKEEMAKANFHDAFIGDTDPREIDPEALRHVRVITRHKTSPVEKKNAAADLKAYLIENYGDEDGTEKYDRYVEGLDIGDGNPFSTPLYDKDFSQKEREKLAKSGEAMCLAGETLVVTLDGDLPIGSLIGQKVELLTRAVDGRAKWVTSEVRGFGKHRLYGVNLVSSSGNVATVLATDKHRWYVGSSEVVKFTSELTNGDKLTPIEDASLCGVRQTKAARPEVFQRIDVCGREEVYASVSGMSPKEVPASDVSKKIKTQGSAAGDKDTGLHELRASEVARVLFSESGQKKERGSCCTLSEGLSSLCSKTHIPVPRIEWSSRSLCRETASIRDDFSGIRRNSVGARMDVCLVSESGEKPAQTTCGRSLPPNGRDTRSTLYQLQSHVGQDGRYCGWGAQSSRIPLWTITGVTDTGRVEEVYCPIVPETHRFVLAGQILTGNSGGGFPIQSKQDLENAIHAIGRAKNPAAAKAHIIKRARALGATESLPADWVKSTTTDRKGDTTMSAIVVIDGARLEVADNLTANVIEKHVSGLHSMAADLKGKLDKAAADKEEADEEDERQQKDAKAKIDAKDGEIAALKKQLADSQAKTTPEILDQLVKDRAAVIDRAAKVLDKAFVFDGKKPEDIRRAAVVRGLGDAACKDMSDAAIEGAFLALTSGKGNGVGQLADALSRPGHRGNGTDTRDAAFGEHINYLHNAWKGPQKQAS